MRSSRAVAALASDWRPDSAIRGVIFTDTRNAECGDIAPLACRVPLARSDVCDGVCHRNLLCVTGSGPFDRVAPTSTRQHLQS